MGIDFKINQQGHDHPEITQNWGIGAQSHFWEAYTRSMQKI
jgi:hypothetical protein